MTGEDGKREERTEDGRGYTYLLPSRKLITELLDKNIIQLKIFVLKPREWIDLYHQLHYSR